MRVLAGDIGGTKTLLQIVETGEQAHRVLYRQRYDSQAFQEFQPLFASFLEEAGKHTDAVLDAACLAVAGPVQANTASVTNLPWVLDGDELGNLCGLPGVALINDFQAVGYGLEGLSEEDIFTLQQGQQQIKQQGPRVLIGAGTGLGEAVMVDRDGRWEVLASEGGHVDFAPTDPLQVELLKFLWNDMERVTYERLLSGPGLVRIYRFLQRRHPELAGAVTISEQHDAAAEISSAALSGDALAEQALDLFVRIYGAQAGNLALTVLASGGVYIAGGIAPKIIDKLQDGVFMHAFNNKPPMSSVLEGLSVKVVMNPDIGLIGATLVAARYKAH